MKQKMKVVKVVRETSDTCTLTLKGSEKLEYKPGQFVMIELLRDEKIPKRAYSVSSSPTRDLEITIKKIPDGWVSKILTELEKGEELMVDGPYGHFVFDSEKMKEIVLLSAGSGIAPFRCFSQYILDKKLDTKVTFVYCNKTEEDIIFHKELKELDEKLPEMDLMLSLTREEKGNFLCGRIDDAFIKKIIAKTKDPYYFICGPPKMVIGVKQILLDNGVEKDRIKIEAYG